jgi:hypothetical protein
MSNGRPVDDDDLTPEEFSAIVNATRDREALWRRRGEFHQADRDKETDLIASALKKLRRRQRACHASSLGGRNG